MSGWIAASVVRSIADVFAPFAERSPYLSTRLFCGSGERELKG
jgi:hypothetical protein